MTAQIIHTQTDFDMPLVKTLESLQDISELSVLLVSQIQELLKNTVL